jgi:hypothetical protein
MHNLGRVCDFDACLDCVARASTVDSTDDEVECDCDEEEENDCSSESDDDDEDCFESDGIDGCGVVECGAMLDEVEPCSAEAEEEPAEVDENCDEGGNLEEEGIVDDCDHADGSPTQSGGHLQPDGVESSTADVATAAGRADKLPSPPAAVHSGVGGGSLDCTQLPTKLNALFAELDTDGAVRATKIAV